MMAFSPQSEPAPDSRSGQTFGRQTPFWDFAAPIGDSIGQVFLRQQSVASQLVADRVEHRILVLDHTWALRLLAAILADLGPARKWYCLPSSSAHRT